MFSKNLYRNSAREMGGKPAFVGFSAGFGMLECADFSGARGIQIFPSNPVS